jgi:sulfatase maturation enzyme AslB (radical SAM superfamily)
MAVDWKFVLTGAKRVVDSRPMYAQVVVTDDCNLTCSYCDEYTPGAPIIPLEELKKRIDKLDELGVLVYDLLGGETMMHPQIAELVAHIKSKRGGSNLATIITNGFLLTEKNIHDLNEAGLDFMQVSVDSLHRTDWSDKALKSILPRLKVLAKEARFTVEIQTVLNELTLDTYAEFRETLKDFPFAFGFSVMHGKGGKIAIKGEKFLNILEKYGVFEGVNFYGDHLKEMLVGDFSRKWKCLGGFKFVYLNSAGGIQWCSQQRAGMRPLMELTPEKLRRDNKHKPCEAGCSLGCVRMVSHTLGEPLSTMGASLKLAVGMSRKQTNSGTAESRPPRNPACAGPA